MAMMFKSVQDQSSKRSVKPSVQNETELTPFTLDQELTVFGQWTSNPMWVPPKDASNEMAKSMLSRFGAFASKDRCWSAITAEHRSKFTQVREIELKEASIRLPKSRLFVSVTEREDFDKITDEIPKCVQTRLDEFLDGPGKRLGVKVYYLKPLCVEVENELIFTTGDEVNTAIANIQKEVFAAYRRLYLWHRPAVHAMKLADFVFAKPRRTLKYLLQREKRTIDRCHAQLEFNRRKLAMKASKMRKYYRQDECTYESILALTKPVQRECVILQYAQELELSPEQLDRFVDSATRTLPWFVAMPLCLSVTKVLIAAVAAVGACDPVFVAEMPGAKGRLLKIGHFDVVDGVMHVEI